MNLKVHVGQNEQYTSALHVQDLEAVLSFLDSHAEMFPGREIFILKFPTFSSLSLLWEPW